MLNEAAGWSMLGEEPTVNRREALILVSNIVANLREFDSLDGRHVSGERLPLEVTKA